jgi:hypothetical protein
VTTKNAGELLAILELCGRYGAISLQLINREWGSARMNSRRAAIGNHPELLREQIPRLRARAKELGVELQIPEYFGRARRSLPRAARQALAPRGFFRFSECSGFFPALRAIPGAGLCGRGRLGPPLLPRALGGDGQSDL